MRVMLLIKGDPQPGAAPSEELVGAMGSYNEELKEAGVLIDLAAPGRQACPDHLLLLVEEGSVRVLVGVLVDVELVARVRALLGAAMHRTELVHRRVLALRVLVLVLIVVVLGDTCRVL